MTYPYKFSTGAACARPAAQGLELSSVHQSLVSILHGSSAFQRPAIVNNNRKTMGFARGGPFGAALARYVPANNNEITMDNNRTAARACHGRTCPWESFKGHLSSAVQAPLPRLPVVQAHVEANGEVRPAADAILNDAL